MVESRVEVFLTELVGVAVGPEVAWKVREDGENVVFEVFLVIDKVAFL